VVNGDRRSDPTRDAEALDRVVIRFAGDSGDGMQLVGDRFTEASAAFRQRPRNLPELPGRDPRACRHARRRLVVPGRTSRTHDIVTPGDTPNVLVAMNPAA
jgi:2-oxoglutarate ferredoxin oxidoreductase subunit alpha